MSDHTQPKQPDPGQTHTRWGQMVEAALAHSRSAVIVLDASGRIEFANPALEQLIGRSCDSLRDGFPGEFYRICSTNAALRETWKVEGGGEAWVAQIELYTATGATLTIPFLMTPIVDGSTEPKGFVCIQHQGVIDSEVSSELESQREAMDVYGKLVATYSTQLQQAMTRIDKTLIFAIQALTSALDARDTYTAGHSFRVSHNSCLIASRLGGMTYDEIEEIHVGALLHDIGKVGIPDSILRKPSPLTPEEYEIVKMHPSIGHTILVGIPQFAEALSIVRHHHERLDGSGYPDGLSGDQISVGVRCVTVSDVFDALVSARPYRPSLSPERAIEVLRKEAKLGWWDEELVELLTELFAEGVLSVSAEDQLPPGFFDIQGLAA